ncbi:hypothetical protein AVEN_274155-1 [Araneus ventricosus]|uniref:PLAT domain-containing protein n=1 Tax=Araneus ventricosus TaxID=182803 RepID=A0A4Y2G1X6_ARAVE|nr:hypothetical protein AVEN_274155-1 [Araneus ventricosus]
MFAIRQSSQMSFRSKVLETLSAMGRIWSHLRHDETDRELVIHVTTGDRKRAGTDANVWIILYDEKDQATDTIKLNRTLKNDHERGDTCTFLACSGNGFGQPIKADSSILIKRPPAGVAWKFGGGGASSGVVLVI